jgi:uncharacterized membrane protein YgcG
MYHSKKRVILVVFKKEVTVFVVTNIVLDQQTPKTLWLTMAVIGYTVTHKSKYPAQWVHVKFLPKEIVAVNFPPAAATFVLKPGDVIKEFPDKGPMKSDFGHHLVRAVLFEEPIEVEEEDEEEKDEDEDEEVEKVAPKTAPKKGTKTTAKKGTKIKAEKDEEGAGGKGKGGLKRSRCGGSGGEGGGGDDVTGGDSDSGSDDVGGGGGGRIGHKKLRVLRVDREEESKERVLEVKKEAADAWAASEKATQGHMDTLRGQTVNMQSMLIETMRHQMTQ